MSDTPSVPDLKVIQGKPPVQLPEWAEDVLKAAGRDLFAVSQKHGEAQRAIQAAAAELERIRGLATQVEQEASHLQGRLNGTVDTVLKSLGLAREDVSGFYDAQKDTFVLVHEKEQPPQRPEPTEEPDPLREA